MDVRWRGRPRQVPHASEGIGEPQPDEALTVLEGVDLVCERRRYDEVVGDDTARLVAATEGVREAQGHVGAGASADCQLALSSCERAVIDRERVGVSPIEEEPESPGAPPRSPDDPHLRLLTRRWSFTPWSSWSRNCVKVAVRKSRFFRASALIALILDSLSLTAAASVGRATLARSGPTLGTLLKN